MTREEQLACLTDRPCKVCKFHGENGCCKWNCVFEEEPTDAEPCEDAISRQAVLDAFGLFEKTRKYGGDHSGYDTMMLYEIQQTLEDLPSVTPKQRTGQWIRHTDASGNSWHTCPACGHVAYTLTRFCPDCGACLEAPS